MKRLLPAAQEPPTKKRSVSHGTFNKWKAELDKDYNTMSWLDCETVFVAGKKTVIKLKCKLCTQFESKIAGRRNYSDRWVMGADSIRTSNIKDHATTDQHTHATLLSKKEQAEAAGQGPSSYAPIAKALHHLSEDAKGPLRAKFDVAYVIATEKLAFTNSL